MTGVALAACPMTAPSASASPPVGQVIRAARHEAGLTLDQVAARLHVAKSLVSRWESGHRRFVGPIARTCCDLLDLPRDLAERSYLDRIRVPGLAAVRRARGLTQRLLASQLGMHTETVGGWERGEAHPTERDVAALCRVLRLADPRPLLRPVVAPPPSPTRIARLRAGYARQRDAAAALGISRERLCDLERGRARPTLRELRAMAQVYSVDLGELARAVGVPPPRFLTRRRPVPGTFPLVLAEALEWRGWTTTRCAREALVAARTVRYWLSGAYRPTPRRCASLERLLDLPAGTLTDSR